MVIYLVYENYAMMGPSIVLKAFKRRMDAESLVMKLAKKQKNKPQYDDWGLCSGIEYIVSEIEVD
jgi:hypothetical protein